MPVTGLANLAVKVSDLDSACAFYEASGAEVRDRMTWNNGERADVYLGPVMITLFTRAIYEDAVDLPAEGFLHPALFVDDLDTELEAITRRGIPVGEIEVAAGLFRRVTVSDPDGNTIQLAELPDERG